MLATGAQLKLENDVRKAIRKIDFAALMPHYAASILINLLAITIPLAALLIYDRVLPTSGLSTLGMIIFGVAILIAMDSVLRFARMVILTQSGARYDHVLRHQVLKVILSRRHFDGNMLHLSQLTSALSAIRTVREYRFLRLQAVVDLPFGLAFLVMIAVIGGWLAIIPATICLIFAVCGLALALLTEQSFRTLNTADRARNTFSERVYDNLWAIKIQAAELPMIGRFLKLQAGRSSAVRSQVFASLITRDSYSIFSQVLIGSVIVVSALSVLNGNLTFGGLAACTLLSGRALEPLQTAFQLIIQSRQVRAAEAEILQVASAASARETLVHTSVDELWRTPPSIQMRRGMTPSLPSVNTEFRGVDLDIASGETVTITGDRGQGKTTLARIIMGLVPASGEVRIGDVVLGPATADIIRANTTYICREPDLPPGRIIDVLADGDEDNFADVRYLSHLLGLDELIKRLPNGYDTQLSASSAVVPSGALQQIALIRGIARKRKLLILDDATLLLDAGAELRLAQILKMLKGEATIIMLTDRAALSALADRRLDMADFALVADERKRA